MPPTKTAYENMCKQNPNSWQAASAETADIQVDGLDVST